MEDEMSDENDRIKHSRRISKTRNAEIRQVKIARAHGITVKEYHRYAKHHAMNCGRPHCMLCSNPRRTWREKTIQEQKFEKQIQADKRKTDE
jgi:hypothetical protein